MIMIMRSMLSARTNYGLIWKALAWLSLVLLPRLVCAQLAYTVTVIPQGAPNGINSSGQLTLQNTPHGSGNPYTAYLYTNGAVQQIPDLGGGRVLPTHVNDSGVVVGYAAIGGIPGLVYNAFAFDSITNTMTDLDTAPGYSYAYGSSNAGEIVGQATFSDGLHAAIFTGNSVQDLGALEDGPESEAVAVNDAGEIVGHSYTPTGPEQPFVYSNGQMRSLGPLGIAGQALAINDAGTIVGTSAFVANARYTFAFISDGTNMINIGALGGISSAAYAINDQGDVVGSAELTLGHSVPFLYHDGVMVNLDTFLPVGPNGIEYLPDAAVGINDAGQIICKDGNETILLTPVVPSPSSLPITVGIFTPWLFSRRRASPNRRFGFVRPCRFRGFRASVFRTCAIF